TFTSNQHASGKSDYQATGTLSYDDGLGNSWTLATRDHTEQDGHNNYDSGGSFGDGSTGSNSGGSFTVDFDDYSLRQSSQDGTYSQDDRRQVRSGTLHKLDKIWGDSSETRNGTFSSSTTQPSSVSGTFVEDGYAKSRREYTLDNGVFGPSPHGSQGNYYFSPDAAGTFSIDQLATSSDSSHHEGTLSLDHDVLMKDGTFTADQDSGGHDYQSYRGSGSWQTYNSDATTDSNHHNHQEGDIKSGRDVVTKIHDTITDSGHTGGHAEGRVYTGIGGIGTFTEDSSGDTHQNYNAEATISGRLYSFSSVTNDQGDVLNTSFQSRVPYSLGVQECLSVYNRNNSLAQTG